MMLILDNDNTWNHLQLLIFINFTSFKSNLKKLISIEFNSCKHLFALSYN